MSVLPLLRQAIGRGTTHPGSRLPIRFFRAFKYATEIAPCPAQNNDFFGKQQSTVIVW